MTWSAQRRKKSAQKMVTATTPRIAIRIAACGVTRYGSSTRGSGGRKPRGRLLLGLDNRDYLTALTRRDREDPATEPIEGIREQKVQRERWKKHPREELRRRDRLSEHEVEDRRAEADADRPDRHRDERRVRRRLLGHLAETPGEVAGECEKERGQAERLERDDVENESGPEACRRTERRPS